MLNEINPGDQVRIRITREPTNAAARKTLQRVLSRDATVRRENERLRRARGRHTKLDSRGGQPWYIRPPKQHPVRARPGEEGVVRASVDVLRDLHSARKFIDVSKA